MTEPNNSESSTETPPTQPDQSEPPVPDTPLGLNVIHTYSGDDDTEDTA
jgi:hypothetical protein